MKIFGHYTLPLLALLVMTGSLCAGDVSDWQFQWELEREKERHWPDIKKYSSRADDHLVQGNYWRARYNYKKLYKVSRSLHNRGHARLGVAVAHYGDGNYREAFEELKETIAQYANFIPFDKALELEYTIAREHFQNKKDLLFASLNDAAIEVYEHIQEVAPFSKHAETSLYEAGMLQVQDGNLNAATVLLTKLINRYPQSEYRVDARLALAHSLLRMARVAEGDPLLEKRARSELRMLIVGTLTEKQNQHLQELLKMADEIAAQKLLFLARFYQRQAHWNPDASRAYITEFLKNHNDHPDVPVAEELLARLPGSEEDQ